MREYKYHIGDIINELEILSKIKINNNVGSVKGYVTKCLKCGYVHEKYESNLEKGRKCPCCLNKICVKGINDIATTHPHLVKYFANIEDAYTHTYASGKRVLMRCPDCKFEKMMIISNLSSHGFSCNVCSDGISYPNKFILNMLSQLNIDFEPEKSFNWSYSNVGIEKVNGIKIYDIFIPKYNLLIENHGLQHYENVFNKVNENARTLDEEMLNDSIKKTLAEENGYTYVAIDCRTSDCDWIRNSIMNTIIPMVLNFKENDINWIKCDKSATSSKVKTVCDMFKNGIKDTGIIAKSTMLCRDTVVSYLKRGAKIGWCDYDSIEAYKTKSNKKVYVYKDNEMVGDYESISDCEKCSVKDFGIFLSKSRISSAINGKIPSYKGYVFLKENIK